jgi:hypothetical protein
MSELRLGLLQGMKGNEEISQVTVSKIGGRLPISWIHRIFNKYLISILPIDSDHKAGRRLESGRVMRRVVNTIQTRILGMISLF